VNASPRVLFIADLHLDPSRPDITAGLLELLREQAKGADHLYILGDLFEAWIGDDAPAPPADAVAPALKQLADAGVPISFMVGNRDFLLGHVFCDTCGMTLLTEPHVLDLYGRKTLLMHGDSLCTDDVAYQQFRHMVRNSNWQAEFLAKPLAERLAMAQQARKESKAHTGSTNATIMDVNSEAVEATFAQHQVERIIHGHTHRPAIHQLPGGRQRIVLGDWGQQGSVLTVTPNGTELQHFVLQSP
jgi:UDP-2,3-diacylglucosamine hydrolase